jgi:hypothetical protein
MWITGLCHGGRVNLLPGSRRGTCSKDVRAPATNHFANLISGYKDSALFWFVFLRCVDSLKGIRDKGMKIVSGRGRIWQFRNWTHDFFWESI